MQHPISSCNHRLVPKLTTNPVHQYLTGMRTAHALGAHTAETTFYTPFANLLNSVGEGLKPRVFFQAHPGSHGAGIVDGGLYPLTRKMQKSPLPNQKPERGAVEIKPAGTSMEVLAQSSQVRKYLEAYGLCLISNYHQFRLLDWYGGAPRTLESYDITANAGDLWTLPVQELTEKHQGTLPDFLARVRSRKGPLSKAEEVAWLIASYAREARARAESHPLAAFAAVKTALQESLGITFEGDKGENFFLSTLIQTLFYGIFSAWILWRRSPDFTAHGGAFNWRFSADYLRIPVLRTLFELVSQRGALNTVQIIEVLNHANDALNRVERDFFTTFREEEAVQYFYEPFLKAFDPELRKQLGVWYTPREIVRYMVERVDHLLRTELNEPLGLASPNVQVLDPCCGTGAYLVEVLHRIERTLREQAGDDDALVGADLRRAATTRIFGFEIMPAPFVIAHLQIAQLLEDAKASLTEDQRALVYLTNALTGWVPVRHPQSNFGFPAFTQERDAAEAVKQADTILVILGNPPYNGYAGIAQVEEERGLTTAYREQLPGLAAPQGQGLNDLYVRFFRIAERRVVGDGQARGNRNGRGLISFISNNAWLDGLSHVSMRARYLREFQSIYIDNLNGDKYRTGKTTPDGKPDPSAFSTSQNREGIQVGTAIATLVRTGSRSTNHTNAQGLSSRSEAEGSASVPADSLVEPFIRLRELWGTHKLSNLDREAKRETTPAYDDIRPAFALSFPFGQRKHASTYTTWPRLPEIFPTSFPGIKTSRDSLLVDIDRERLEKRIRLYLNSGESDTVVAANLPSAMEARPRFDPFAARHKLLESGFRPWQVITYSYRPFDVRWLYWEPRTKLLDEKREEYLGWTVFPTFTLIAQQKTRTVASPAQIVTSPACLDLMDRGATCFPISGLAEANFDWVNGRNNRQSGPVRFLCPNFSDAAEDYVASFSILGDPGRDAVQFEKASQPLFFHALAVMHAQQYRTENAGALLVDWPRIPLPAYFADLARSAELGRRLAELLNPESEIKLQEEWSFLARLYLPAEVPDSTRERDRNNAARFAVTAGWGRAGQGNTVMPSRGHAPERDWTEKERERLRTLAAAQSLSFEEVVELLGGRCVDVYLNRKSHWAAVPVKVWQYTLGGYQVLKKWLSYREEPLLGGPLHEDAARYFAQVVRRIAAILLMGPALDRSYAAIVPTATGLPK